MATVEQWNKFYTEYDAKNGGRVKTLLLTSRRFQKKFYNDWNKHCEENAINPLFEFMMKK